MAYSKVQLRDAVLVELGVLAAGETATAEDAAEIERALVRLHARLTTRKPTLVTWTLDTVPDYAADPYILMCAGMTAGKFGLNAQRRQELLTLAGAGEIELNRLIGIPWDGGPTPIDGVPVLTGDDYGSPVDAGGTLIGDL